MTTQIGMHFRDAPSDVESPKRKTQNEDADQHRKPESASETWMLLHTVVSGTNDVPKYRIVNHLYYMCYSLETVIKEQGVGGL